MSSKLIIVADLQHFKVFRVKKDPRGIESLEHVQSSDSLDIHQRLSEKVSDRKGNFQNALGGGSGEAHNIGLEQERRRIKEIAGQISKVIKDRSYESWSFSAPKAINNQIVESLDSKVRESLVSNLHIDLTNLPSNQILGRFSK